MLQFIKRGEAAEGGKLVERLLRARGIKDAAEREAFLHPGLAQLRDPFALPAMREAVALIEAAIREEKHLCVYGDYDVDGVCATAMLTMFLRDKGASVEPYIPSRHEEGYGLNERAVRAIAERADLLITVDCGVCSAELIDLARELGLSAIVTDHHQPDGHLPRCPVVSPMLDGYPFPYLCGAGVAFKLLLALDETAGREYIDLAALATVADVMPLVDENRAIVRLGLSKINAAPRPGLQALMEAAGLKPGTCTAYGFGFQLGPRLNAGGRLGDANRARRLLMAATREEAQPLAAELDAENARRKDVEKAILAEAERMLAADRLSEHKAIVLAGADWNTGVIGLVAGRLTSKYHFPTILLAEEGEWLHGSCRSIPGVDIHKALTLSDKHIERFGGHEMAAGLTLRRDKLADFRAALDLAIAQISRPDDYIPTAEYDLAVALEELDEPSVRELALFEPTGMGNPAPVFLSEARVAGARRIGRDGAHLKLSLTDASGRALDGVWFGAGGKASALAERDCRLLYAANINEYMGRVSVQCLVREAQPALTSGKFWADGQLYDLQRAYLTSLGYNKALIPADEAVPPARITEWLAESPFGTLLVATTAEACARADFERLDRLAGTWPDDPRRFNTLCFLPAGDPPEGYKRMVALDKGAREYAITGAARYRLAESAGGWLDELPGREELRAIYAAARQWGREGTPFRPEAFAAKIGLAPIAARAGLMALEEMGLLRCEDRPARLEMLPMQKIDPRESPLFCRMQTLRKGDG